MEAVQHCEEGRLREVLSVCVTQVVERQWEEHADGGVPEASGEAGDEEFMMMALFDDDAAQSGSQGFLQLPAKAPASPLIPWGTENHRRRKKGLKGELEGWQSKDTGVI
jgi:hypothetical protein